METFFFGKSWLQKIDKKEVSELKKKRLSIEELEEKSRLSE